MFIFVLVFLKYQEYLDLRYRSVGGEFIEQIIEIFLQKKSSLMFDSLQIYKFLEYTEYETRHI